MNRSTARCTPIDLLKGLAIISVILLHSWDNSFLLRIGAPYYISQSVPIFIIIAAYNGVDSYFRANANTLIQCYYITHRRFNRLFLPYCIYLIIDYSIIILMNKQVFIKNETMFASIADKMPALIMNVLSFFVTGGYGAGSYFVPVLVQLILTLPILYLFGSRNIKFMIIGALIFDMIFEIYALKFGMPGWIYERIYMRYLFAAALGVWLFFGINKIWLTIGGSISIIYITMVTYWGYIPPMQTCWGSQNAPSFMWTLAIVAIGLHVLPKNVNNSHIWFIAEIGKASYHIFLSQMVYFWVMGDSINKFSGAIVINLVICISIGLLYYYLFNWRRLFLKFRKNVLR